MAAFDRLYGLGPIVDPQGRSIVFEPGYGRHVCIREERFEKRRMRSEGADRIRREWAQERAEHIPWIGVALTSPSLIVPNNKVPGNLVYLLGYPKGDFTHPKRRYYVSVKPLSRNRFVFKTGYPISQEEWDEAVRAPKGMRGRRFVLHQGPSPRW